jgi:hypothetical protein
LEQSIWTEWDVALPDGESAQTTRMHFVLGVRSIRWITSLGAPIIETENPSCCIINIAYSLSRRFVTCYVLLLLFLSLQEFSGA